MVFVPRCVLVLVVFLFCISYVTNLELWLHDFNKLTYLLTWTSELHQFLISSLYVHERSDHLTDALVSLHWLRVPERIQYTGQF